MKTSKEAFEELKGLCAREDPWCGRPNVYKHSLHIEDATLPQKIEVMNFIESMGIKEEAPYTYQYKDDEPEVDIPYREKLQQEDYDLWFSWDRNKWSVCYPTCFGTMHIKYFDFMDFINNKIKLRVSNLDLVRVEKSNDE